MTKKIKINFRKIKIGKPIKVDFYTKEGEKIAFKPNGKISKPLKVKFYDP